ncbi:MAG TPA: hypothetical protein VGI17_17180 [Solirubrobacterales bacterium]|jgi:hypothetical protein
MEASAAPAAIDSAVLAKALSHPERVRILMAFNTPKRRLSPARYAEEQGTGLSKATYHFGRLRKFKMLKLVDEKQVRGATEHLYEATEAATAWPDTWKRLPDATKQILAGTVAGGFVEALGASLEARTFDRRDDSVLGWSSIRLDEAGAEKVAKLMNRTLELMLSIEKDCAERLAPGDPSFLLTYCVASFEAAPLKVVTPEPGAE